VLLAPLVGVDDAIAILLALASPAEIALLGVTCVAGNLALEESLKVFEEGTGLLRFCTRRLEAAERRIEILLQDEGGARTEPFRWEEGQG